MPADRQEPRRLHQRSHSGHSQDYNNQQQPMVQPPVPYQQFEYSFPTSFPEQLLPPAPLEGSSSSNELFSASEQNNLLGFLDQFEWQFDPLLPASLPTFNQGAGSQAPTINLNSAAPQPKHGSPSRPAHTRRPSSSSSSLTGAVHQHVSHSPTTPHASGFQSNSLQSSGLFSQPMPHPNTSQYPQIHVGPHTGAQQLSGHPKTEPVDDVSRLSGPLNITGGFLPFMNTNTSNQYDISRGGAGQSIADNALLLSHPSLSTIDPSTAPSDSLLSESPVQDGPLPGGNLTATTRPTKPVLSTPEKRYRHIQSEQRRRNTIRDGYAQLTTLLAPHPSAASRTGNGGNAKGKRTRGGDPSRPKGTRGRTRGKGKSGVLFRAVEYIRWLEENVEDLSDEVEKLEKAALALGLGAADDGKMLSAAGAGILSNSQLSWPPEGMHAYNPSLAQWGT